MTQDLDQGIIQAAPAADNVQVATEPAGAAAPVQIAADDSWMVEATGSAIQNREQFTQFYQQSRQEREELAALKSQPRFANPLVEKVNALVSSGAGTDDVLRFLNFQKLDVTTLSPEDAVRQWASAKNPAYAAEGAIDDYIEDELGLKGFKDGTLKETPMLRAKLATMADEAKTFLSQQKVAAETPQSVIEAQQAAVAHQRFLAENETIAVQMAEATKKLTYDVGDIIDVPGQQYEFAVPATVKINGVEINVNQYVGQVAKAILNDSSIPNEQRKNAAAEFSAIVRKGLIADAMLRDIATDTKMHYLKGRAGQPPVPMSGGKIH